MRCGTGQRQVHDTFQPLQQQQGCASSACKAESAVAKQALQSRLAAAHVVTSADLAPGDVLSGKGPTA